MELHYEVLEVDPTADAKTIKKQYHKMALKNHPDKGGSKEAFQKINKANEILSDPEKRKRYDRLGIDWEVDEAEEKKMMEDLQVTMEPAWGYLMRVLVGAVYVFCIQYFWMNVLLSLGLGFLMLKAEDLRWMIGGAIILGWLSRQGPWLHFGVETIALGVVMFAGLPSPWNLAGGGVALFIAWWFAGRLFYYVCLLGLGLVLILQFWLLMIVSMASRREAWESKLEKFASEVKPYVRNLRKENTELKKEIALLKAKLNTAS
mmetsp:Transcript_5198/g.9894  ORF Transcript_5198/g.9894 Transcript_5198/m.9894 type:complete len:261 (-) Transcript_5198:202-984(-)|eukprot:CAMPEP_0167791940 /NCGR_PEP_ID=MMETSP0111_2-20121227/12263_1 /TAXON_ID=91324 /ORGANISM="Lotharella globosa, Strain CCCM811" /LENGTH=260 /DNA_ID=CAMNT_0007684761 /DNA_START=112 /DNA_END=894 /DNA_ORIENTATION=-